MPVARASLDELEDVVVEVREVEREPVEPSVQLFAFQFDTQCAVSGVAVVAGVILERMGRASALLLFPRSLPPAGAMSS